MVVAVFGKSLGGDKNGPTIKIIRIDGIVTAGNGGSGAMPIFITKEVIRNVEAGTKEPFKPVSIGNIITAGNGGSGGNTVGDNGEPQTWDGFILG